MVGYESHAHKSCGGPGVPSPSVVSSPSCSPFPYQEPGSTQKSLGVYVHISTTNRGEHSKGGRGLTVTPTLEAYSFYRSVTGRLERLKFESQGKVRVDLHKLKRRLFYIERRLQRWRLSEEERSVLLEEREKLLRTARKLLEFVHSRSALYGDRFIMDVPAGYVRLCRLLGIDPSDVGISVWVNSSVVDLEFDDSSRSSLKLSYVSRVMASKYHPVKGISKGSQEGRRITRDLLILQELLDGFLLSSHKGKYVTANSLLPLRFFVLTPPKEVSLFIWYRIKFFDDYSALKTFKKVSAETVRSFLMYLSKKEGLSIRKGDFVPGFALNVHITGDSNPFEPHVHSHVAVPFVVYDKASKSWYRLNPLLSEEDLQKLRDLWKSRLIEAFGEVLSGETLTKEFNVYAGDRYYSLPHDYVEVLFELRYNARKMFVNYANFYERNPFREDVDLDFVRFVFGYENRTERYGFLTNLRRYLTSISVSAIQKKLEEVEEMLRLVEDELLVLDPEEFSALRRSLEEKAEALRAERDRLKSLLEDPDRAFDVLFEEAQRKAEEMLSRERITEERIIHILEGLYGKRIIGYKFVTVEEDVPLWKFLESNPSLVLLSDRHKTIDFLLFMDPYWEDPPDPEFISVGGDQNGGEP